MCQQREAAKENRPSFVELRSKRRQRLLLGPLRPPVPLIAQHFIAALEQRSGLKAAQKHVHTSSEVHALWLFLFLSLTSSKYPFFFIIQREIHVLDGVEIRIEFSRYSRFLKDDLKLLLGVSV